MTSPDNPFATPEPGSARPSDGQSAAGSGASGAPYGQQPQAQPSAPDWQPGQGAAPGYGQQGPPAGYAPGYGSAPGYGPPPGPAGGAPVHWGQPQTTCGTAIGALIAACVSWLLIPVIPAIVALVLIPSAQREIDASGGRLTGDSLLTAARWVAWSNIVVCLGGVLLVVLLFAVPFAFV